MTDRQPTYRNGQMIDDHFRVLRTIFGGMGEVIFCDDLSDSKRYVLKTYFVDDKSDRGAKDRFIREAETWLRLGRCSSNFVMPLLDIHTIEGKPWLRTEYLPLGSLRNAIGREMSV
jgi:serine/threonine protein kinase